MDPRKKTPAAAEELPERRKRLGTRSSHGGKNGCGEQNYEKSLGGRRAEARAQRGDERRAHYGNPQSTAVDRRRRNA